jgi:hypothetical protein
MSGYFPALLTNGANGDTNRGNTGPYLGVGFYTKPPPNSIEFGIETLGHVNGYCSNMASSGYAGWTSAVWGSGTNGDMSMSITGNYNALCMKMQTSNADRYLVSVGMSGSNDCSGLGTDWQTADLYLGQNGDTNMGNTGSYNAICVKYAYGAQSKKDYQSAADKKMGLAKVTDATVLASKQHADAAELKMQAENKDTAPTKKAQKEADDAKKSQ